MVLRLGLHGKILLFGAHPDPRPSGPPLRKRAFELRIERSGKQDLLLRVGLLGKKIFGCLPHFEAHRVHFTKMGKSSSNCGASCPSALN